MGTVFSQRPDVHLKAILVRVVRFEFPTAWQADVPDTELPAIDRLPLALDEEKESHHYRMSILPASLIRRPIHIVAGIFGSLWEHEVAARILRLDFEHGEPSAHMMRLAARSQPPAV
jgi:hypothetical protein